MQWSDRAACVTAEPEVFFPVGGDFSGLDEVSVAKLICSNCEVVDECRDYALSTRQPFGVWGGLDEQERRVIWGGAVPATAH